MILPAAVPPDLLTLLAALFLLFGVPAILFGLIMLYTGYVRYDGERFLDELEPVEEHTRPPDDDGEQVGKPKKGGADAHAEDDSPPS